MKRKIDPEDYSSVQDCIGLWNEYFFDKKNGKKAGHISIKQQINRIRKIRVLK